MGKNLISTARVPDIDVVEESRNNPGLISYKILDNDEEDMFHIRDLMFYKYEREELEEKQDIFTIEDILECVKVQIRDDENYKKVERSMIHTLLLDSVMNNGDRHSNNWALVRNKNTNWYELAIFDHSISLIDMIEEKTFYTYDGWVSSYVTVNENNRNAIRKGGIGNDIVKYISKNYREYFEEFCNIFNEKLPNIIGQIKEENLPIDMRRLEKKLHERKHYLDVIRDREEER